MVYLSNKSHFLGVCRHNKRPRDVGRTREKLLNHEPSGSYKLFLSKVWSIAFHEQLLKTIFKEMGIYLYFVIKCLILDMFIE